MNADSIIRKIRNLEIQGAKNVALAGLNALKLSSTSIKSRNNRDFLKKLQKKSRLISSARPTEPALRNAINFVLFKLESHKNAKDIKKVLNDEIKSFSENIEDTIKKIGLIGARRIQNNSTVFTHCHSNTVMEIFRQAKLAGKKFRVICTETRPVNQGLITAKELTNMRIPTTLVVDSAARTFIKKSNLIIIGADAITATGDVVNKIGSATIGLIAEEQRKPLYVAAGTHKIDPETADGLLEPIEERPGKEIIDPKKLKGVKINNPAFDVVDANRIKGIITELGIVPPHIIYEIMKRKFSRRGV